MFRLRLIKSGTRCSFARLSISVVLLSNACYYQIFLVLLFTRFNFRCRGQGKENHKQNSLKCIIFPREIPMNYKVIVFPTDEEKKKKKLSYY